MYSRGSREVMVVGQFEIDQTTFYDPGSQASWATEVTTAGTSHYMKQLILCLFLLAIACKDQRPPTPTQQQSQQLNEAEDMLNSMANNEEGPANRSAGPSNQSD